MADAGYLEFSYNAEKVRQLASDLDTAKSRMNDYNLSSLISQLQNCRGWSRISGASGYISRLNAHKNDATTYNGKINKEKSRILDTLAALEAFDGEVITTETHWWADAAMIYYNFEEGFLTGFEQVLDGLMTGAAVVCGWMGFDEAANAIGNAVDYEIVGEFYDWRFENDPWMQLVEKHATYNHDDPACDNVKGFGTIVSYVAMAALAGGGLGAVGVSGGAWSGAASIIGDVLVTGIGTLGAETDNNLEQGQDIMTAAANAADDALLAAAVAGTVGSFIEFGPGMLKTGFNKMFGEAAQEGTEMIVKESTQQATDSLVSKGVNEAISEGAEEINVVLMKDASGAVAELTQEEFEQLAKQAGLNSAEELTQQLSQNGVQVATDTIVKTGPNEFTSKAMMEGAGELFGEGAQAATNQGAQTATNEAGQLLLTDGSQAAANETAQAAANETAQTAANETAQTAANETTQTAVSETTQQATTTSTKEQVKEAAANGAQTVAGETIEEVENKTIKNITEEVEDRLSNRGRNQIIDAIPTRQADEVIPTSQVTDLVPTNQMDELVPTNQLDELVPTNQSKAIANNVDEMLPAGQVDELVPTNQIDEALPTNPLNEAGETGLAIINKEGAEEIAETGLTVAGKEGAEEVAETGLTVAGKEGAEEVAETGLTVAGKEGAEEVAETGLTVAGKEGAEEAAETGLTVAGKEGAEEIAQTGAKEGAEEIIEEIAEQGGKKLPSGAVGIIAGREAAEEYEGDIFGPGNSGDEFPTDGGLTEIIPGTEGPTGPIENPTGPIENPTGPIENPTGPIENPTGPTEGIPEIPTESISEIIPEEEIPTDPITEPVTDPITEGNTETPTENPTGPTENPTGPTEKPTTPDTPTGNDILDDVIPGIGGTDSESTSMSERFEGVEGSLGDIVDLASGVNIPTSADPIRTKINTKDNKMIPLMAGLGAAALAGLGTKAYLERKENKDDEEEIEAEEWDDEEDLELSLVNDQAGLELEESDYLTPNDEFAYAPETADIDSDDSGDRYQATNASELPSMN